MTLYATHRFNVGQRVIRSGERCEIIAQIDGSKGPEYKVRSGSSETVVGERELTYETAPGPLAAARPSFVVH
jgi:hypothetical protein